MDDQSIFLEAPISLQVCEECRKEEALNFSRTFKKWLCRSCYRQLTKWMGRRV